MKAVVVNPFGALIRDVPNIAGSAISAEPPGTILYNVEFQPCSDCVYYKVKTPECEGYIYKDDVEAIEIWPDVLFKCDGRREECMGSGGCYKNGGDCSHTLDITHALNFEKKQHVEPFFYEK